jgi:hypothetical protein
MERLVATLGIDRLSKSQVSEMAKQLDRPSRRSAPVRPPSRTRSQERTRVV